MKTAPGFVQWIPLPFGTIGQVLRNPLDFQLEARRKLGDVVRFRSGPFLLHFLYHPDLIRRVLSERQPNYLRSWQYRFLQRLFGDNLVVTEGAPWKRRRRLAQPAFHHQRLNHYAAIMTDATNQMLESWSRKAANERSINAVPEMAHLAMRIAGKTLFSRDVATEADVVAGQFAVVSNYLEQRFNSPFTTPPLFLPTPGNRTFKQAVGELNRVVMDYIRERRNEGTDRGDLLSMLIDTRDEDTGEQLADEEICSEALTFLIAGHETTATSLAWTLYLLALHPEVQHRIQSEVAAGLGVNNPSFEHLVQLKVTRTVVEESLRLYPPIWIVARQAVEEDEIGGYRIPAKSLVLLSPYVTHRHSDFWEHPDRFDPDRFSEARRNRLHRDAWFPFLAGPHQCIGKEFAMAEMCLIVAMIMQRFELSLEPGPPIQPKASLVLKPDRPVWIKLRKL